MLQKELSEMLHLLKKAQADGAPFSDDLCEAIKDAVGLKKRCKTAIGVDWLLDKILHMQPSSKKRHPRLGQ